MDFQYLDSLVEVPWNLRKHSGIPVEFHAQLRSSEQHTCTFWGRRAGEETVQFSIFTWLEHQEVDWTGAPKSRAKTMVTYVSCFLNNWQISCDFWRVKLCRLKRFMALWSLIIHLALSQITKRHSSALTPPIPLGSLTKNLIDHNRGLSRQIPQSERLIQDGL